MLFILLIFLTAFLMEGIGSWISVIGLSHLFAGDLVILTMAVILDVAKITTVSFLYQYWHEIKRMMRYYLTFAVAVLMLITSVGAFGYLSAAFQRAIQPNKEVTLRLESLKREKAAVDEEKKELVASKDKINKQIENLPADFVSGRSRLIRSFTPELNRINTRLQTVTKRGDELVKEVLKVEAENIENEVHVGPITYVSKAFNVSMEDASKYIIMTIIFVFDPLAIMLVIAGNFLVARRARERQQQVKEPLLPSSGDNLPKATESSVDEDIFSPPVKEVELSAEQMKQVQDVMANPKPLPPEAAEKMRESVEKLQALVEPNQVKPSEEAPKKRRRVRKLKSSLQMPVVDRPPEEAAAIKELKEKFGVVIDDAPETINAMFNETDFPHKFRHESSLQAKELVKPQFLSKGETPPSETRKFYES